MLHIFLLLAATPVLSCNVSPVENLTMTDASSSTITLRWTMPSDDDLKCVRGYKICVTERAYSYKCARVYNASMNEYTINNRASCTLYYVTVVAVGEDYVESGTANLIVTTAPEPVTDLRVERRDEDTITALWNHRQPLIMPCATKFQLSLCDANESSCNNTEVAVASGVWDYGVIGYSQVLHKRPDCIAYTVTIVALDKYQHRSDKLRFTSLPDLVHVRPVRNLATTNVSSSTISLGWTRPSDDDLKCVRGYKICATQQRSSSPICTSVCNASMNEYTINNLTSFSTYYVSVVAIGQNNTDSRTSDLVETTGAAGHVRLSVIIMSTILCLLILSTALQF